MLLYRYFSLLKLGVGIVLLLSIYFLIDPFSDPLLALSGALLGVFLFARGGSYFLFRGRYKFIYRQSSHNQAYSYKLSLLFAFYIMINIILLLQHTRSLTWGIVSLLILIIVQAIALPSSNTL